jgi:hypothetical protein
VGGALLDPKFGPNVTPSQSFRLINLFNPFSSVQGTFFVPASTAPFQVLPNGQKVAFNYTGGNGNDLVITRQNTPPMAPDLAVNVDQIDEGGTVTATGKLVDLRNGDRTAFPQTRRTGPATKADDAHCVGLMDKLRLLRVMAPGKSFNQDAAFLA